MRRFFIAAAIAGTGLCSPASLLAAVNPDAFTQAGTEAETAPLATPVDETNRVPAAVQANQTATAVTIPAGPDILIRIDALVSSRTATRGQMFPISLAEPVVIDGVEIIPAGITGEGQVVHAAGRGFGGRAGELILAARYLNWGDRRIALRSMRVSESGRQQSGVAVAASALVTVAGFLVTGTSAEVQPGEVAAARIAQPVVIGNPSALPIIPVPTFEQIASQSGAPGGAQGNSTAAPTSGAVTETTSGNHPLPAGQGG